MEEEWVEKAEHREVRVYRAEWNELDEEGQGEVG